MQANSNENEGPIGFKPAKAIAGVKVSKRAAFGTESIRSMVQQRSTATAVQPARNVSLAPVARPAVKPPVAVTVAPKVMKTVTPVAPIPAEEAEPKEPTVTLPEKVAELRTPTVAAPKSTTAVPPPPQQDRVTATVAVPPPGDAPILTSQEFFAKNASTTPAGPSIGARLQQKILKDSPVDLEPADKIYRPISAPTFPDFIIQTYSKYPDYLDKLARLRAANGKAPEIDKEACKSRDPNKVENFYYQKFVRDYLQRGSPYRGLLVYHGLGSGKTCTSIAAAEALYWGGQKTIYVMTPATLSNNYRRELGKCGYFPLRERNFWSFLKVPDVTKRNSLEFFWLENVLGLPPSIIEKQGGGWVADPDKVSNWDTMTDDSRETIRAQQRAHLEHRFKFIHYNGVSPNYLSQLAVNGFRTGKSMFDESVVIIDEIHNLVRTINGTKIGNEAYTSIMYPTAKDGKKVVPPVEPREFTWTARMGVERPGFKYPRGYTLYRMLQNAVGCKIIALSATPMINYAQELSVLMNIIGGEQRMVTIPLSKMDRSPGASKILESWAQQHPEIDFYALEVAADGKTTILNVTPVPYGFSKVVAETYETRGFVRLPPSKAGKVENSNERNMDRWATKLLREIEQLRVGDSGKTVLPPGGADEAMPVVEAARAANPPYPVSATKQFSITTFPLLPEDPTTFVNNFIDRTTLKILHNNVLKARTSGLISYYRGGSEETMPRVIANEIVKVPFSDFAFQAYVKARMEEIEQEESKSKQKGTKKSTGATTGGLTREEQDLYAQATTSPSAGFKTFTRAICNWAFPEEVPRPSMSVKQQAKLLGIDQDRVIAANLGIDEEDVDMALDADMEEGPLAEKQDGEAETTAAALPDEPAAAGIGAPTGALDEVLTGVVGTLMSGLEANAELYLRTELKTFSPKYAAMLENIRRSPGGGPVLVYSQFKTLEGLGIFAAALRAAPEQYLPLDIQRDSTGVWSIPAPLMEAAMSGRPLYITYTGDQDLMKRRLLLQLYNADVSSLPPELSKQCATLLRGDPDNRNGKVCKIFMITQSGAEGISLFNTRQVHIMEPYWNNVRLQQVIGRAIRLCSHMNLPWDDRTVEIYTYLSVFSDEQKATGSKLIMSTDKQKTTDESIFEIATKKQTLADGLFEIAQSSAVDCVLHYYEHGGVVQCYKYQSGDRPMFMYHPDWQKDIQADKMTFTRAKTTGGV